MRTVNVHEAKTQFSRLIDAAHAGETILVAKDGKPWARLVPLEPAQPRRQPGVLRGLLQLPSTEALLAPLPLRSSMLLTLPCPFDGPLPPARHPCPALVAGGAGEAFDARPGGHR